MKKILALDPGDKYTGTATSDILHMLAAPHKTVMTYELEKFLTTFFETEDIDTIIVGYPKTLRDTISAQTQKIIDLKERLEKTFPDKNWILWDERFSSQHAEMIQKENKRVDKLHSHSVAAALILKGYLDHLELNRHNPDY